MQRNRLSGREGKLSRTIPCAAVRCTAVTRRGGLKGMVPKGNDFVTRRLDVDSTSCAGEVGGMGYPPTSLVGRFWGIPSWEKRIHVTHDDVLPHRASCMRRAVGAAGFHALKIRSNTLFASSCVTAF